MLEEVIINTITQDIQKDEHEVEIISERDKNKRKCSNGSSGERSDGNSDADEPVKRNKPKQNHRDQITECEDGKINKDLSDSISKEKSWQII